MTIGKRRDAWERTARLIAAWTGEPAEKVIPKNLLYEVDSFRSDVMPYNPKVLESIQQSGMFG